MKENRKQFKENQIRKMVIALKKSNHQHTAEIMYDMISKIVTNRTNFNISLVCNVVLLLLYYA